MRRTLLGLKIAFATITGAAVYSAPVPKDLVGEVIPPPPKPDETLFSGHCEYGIVVSITKTKVTLRPQPCILRSKKLPNDDVVNELLPVDETPIAFFIHPVMKNGGLADQVAGANGYRVNDLKVGDIVTLNHEIGKEKSRWIVAVSIHDRDRKGPPPPFRTEEQWREISWERMFARDQRLKAKEAAAKNENK